MGGLGDQARWAYPFRGIATYIDVAERGHFTLDRISQIMNLLNLARKLSRRTRHPEMLHVLFLSREGHCVKALDFRLGPTLGPHGVEPLWFGMIASDEIERIAR